MSGRHGIHHHGSHAHGGGHHASRHGAHHGHGGQHGPHHASHPHAAHHGTARTAAHHAAETARRREEARRIAHDAARKHAEKEASHRHERGEAKHHKTTSHGHKQATAKGFRATVALEDPKSPAHKAVHGGAAGPAVGEHGKTQMKNVLDTAARGAGHKRPGGWCYRAVKKFIAQTPGGYGGLNASNIHTIPQARARDFADYMNRNDNAAKHGLRKLDLANPYDAPPGALVVVAPGTPGTHHPTAGDITIAAGHGRFFNDGNMGYGGPGNFPPGNRHVLGIYVPAN